MYYCVIIDDDMYSGHNYQDYQDNIAKKLGVSPKIPFGVMMDKLREVDASVLADVFYRYPDFEALKQGFIYSGIPGLKDAKEIKEIEDAYNKFHRNSQLTIFEDITHAVLGVWHQ